MRAGSVKFTESGDETLLQAVGCWDIANARQLDAELAAPARPPGRTLRFDLSGLEALDTAGAWLVHRTVKRLQAEGVAVQLTGGNESQYGLIEQVAANDRPIAAAPPAPNVLLRVVERFGAGTVDAMLEARAFVGFLGLMVQTFLAGLLRPRRIRFTSLVYHMEKVGFNALPIIGLISFLIGVVLAYQGASQLRQFGADIFVVNLIAISVLRELGILLTSIVVAGRSGSAFTAEIGSMKLREEIDAMRTLGIDPIETLVLPRVAALVLTLPLLGFFADMMGLLGGAVMSWAVLDVSPAVFIERLVTTTSAWHFSVGLIKAPFFAVLIGMVSCYEGLQVTGSAESVGQKTTRSVVEAIFLVIVADATFSIFFNIVQV